MSQLRLYNTLTRKKEDFVPLDAKNVRMYVCGPTVYDFAHIGNARPVIVFDVLFRLLRHLYGENHVKYVRNITDVDDKINARAQEIAKERGIPVMDAIREITAKTAKQYEEDVTALGCLKPTHEPRATGHIKQMIALIEKLIAAKHAYVAEGHVLYDVSSKPDYGKLSRRSLDEMIAGARVEVAPYKDDPLDFVLWKPSPSELPGWDSPWGRGRPGWHIECSAMAEEYLGETFDIHGGGIDLLFPHHENEIAQSEGAHPKSQFARVWLHNGFLQVEGDKMSKSLSNFVTIRDLLKDWPGEVLRFNMLRTHYRQPMDWTITSMKESEIALSELRFVMLEAEPSDCSDEVVSALADDLNTPQALTHIYSLRKKAFAGDQSARDALFMDMLLLGFIGALPTPLNPKQLINETSDHAADLLRLFSMMPGWQLASLIFEHTNESFNKYKAINFYRPKLAHMTATTTIRDIMAHFNDLDLINELIAQRNATRKVRDFKESDRIRDELESKGIILKDNSDGTTNWEVKR